MANAPLSTDNRVEMKARCTTCRKVYTMTSDQMREAREMGVPFSPCCHAVATVERAEVTLSKRRARS